MVVFTPQTRIVPSEEKDRCDDEGGADSPGGRSETGQKRPGDPAQVLDGSAGDITRRELFGAAGEGGEEGLVKRSHQGQDRGVDRGEEVDHAHRPIGVERDRHRGRGGGKDRVGHGEHDLAAVSVAERGANGGEHGGRGELEKRNQTQGRGATHFVGVDEDGDEVRHLRHAEAEVRSEHPPHVPDTERPDKETDGGDHVAADTTETLPQTSPRHRGKLHLWLVTRWSPPSGKGPNPR